MSLTLTRTTTPNVASNIRNAVKSPGIDPRTWITIGVVKNAPVVDSEGVWVDVILQPSGLEECCRLGAVYAGNGFGFYVPLEVDDEVLVAVPDGDFEATSWIISRSWARSDPPPAEIGDNGSPSSDLILVVKENANLKLAVQGSGNISLEARGAGKIFLRTDENATTEPGALGQSLQDRLDQMKTDFDNHGHTVTVASLGVPVLTSKSDLIFPPVPPPVAVSFPSGDVRSEKVELE